MKTSSFKIQTLGQTGFRFEYAGTAVFIDPYLSNSVQQIESADLVRLQPIPIQPDEITDAAWVLITHEHRDHCDLDTLFPISIASKKCNFLGPPKVTTMLQKAGVDSSRTVTAEYGVPLQLNSNCKVFPVPSAHPTVERDTHGRFHCLGYIINIGSKTIYHAGDTSPDEEVMRAVKKFGEIDLAFLPVNERNYFLDRRDIIGNMSIRESFQFAEEIGAKGIVPTHWDMFAANSVYREEIELLYKKISPSFSLFFIPVLPACITVPC